MQGTLEQLRGSWLLRRKLHVQALNPICESGSQAKCRVPPTRPAQVKRLLDAVIGTREEGDLGDQDVLLALDGGKGGVGPEWHQKSVVKLLPGKKYHVLTHLAIYSHESVEKRMERASKSSVELNEKPYEP